MKSKQTILIAGAIVALLAACQKTPEPKTSANTALTPSGGASVALPPDKMPPSDASLSVAVAKPDIGNAASGKADTQSQANPATLKPVQEKSEMPLTGQANNHSEPKALDEKK